MQPGKPTTLQAPFIRPARSQATPRKQSSTVGMGTIASHYVQMTVTLRLSSPPGAGTDHGITLNPEKFVLGADTVKFAGFEITPDSVRPCKKYLNAILTFPKPTNITNIRSWFGLVNQVSYAFAATERMLPFRELLKPGPTFLWNDELDNLFEESKSVIVSEIEEGVRIFDKQKPTCLATDWSKDGIGFWLFQKHCTCTSTQPFCCPTGWKVTLVGSRFTHPAESRYAPIEGESLAVADSLDKARFFVLGCSDLTIAVDHKPLLKILGNRLLEDIPNGRLRNLKEKPFVIALRLSTSRE